MTDPDGDVTELAAELAIRVFELRAGTDFVAFFSDGEAGLPDEEVRQELRFAVDAQDLATGGVVFRGAGAIIANDVIAGIIGAGASAPLVAFLPVTMAWLSKARKRRLNDVTHVMKLVRKTCEEILGSAPASLSDATFQRDADGQWRVAFSYQNVDVTATVAAGGSVVAWKQVPHQAGA